MDAFQRDGRVQKERGGEMKFIILTRLEDGKRIYVNPNNICTFCKTYYADDGTIVSFVGDENCYIKVSESPEAIAKLIEGVTE